MLFHIMNKLFLALTILVAFLLAEKGQTISGTIRDTRTGRPLQQVNIVVRGEGVGTTTDESGVFHLSGLSSGKKMLEISHIGYEPEVHVVKIPISDPLKIRLKQNLIRMDAIVTTGTRTERFLKDVPVTTQIIKGDKLRESGAVDLSQLIQETTGVNVVENQFGTGVELHGFDSDHILILIDGMKIVGRVNGQLDIAQIPLDQIERIEIVKGATSALYGSEAMGGVINILTKNPEIPINLNIESTVGSYGRRNHTLSLSRASGDWNWVLSGGARQSGGYDLDKKTIWEDGSQYEKRNIHLKVNRKYNDRLNIRIDARYFEENQALISSHVFMDRLGNDRASARGKIQYKNGQWSINGSLEQSNYSHILDRVVIKSGNILKGSITQDNLTSSNIQFMREGEIHKMVGGVGYDLESISSDRVQDGFRESDLTNFFIQDEIQISKNWILLGGLRMDDHSIYGQHVSPKISIMFKPEMISRIRLAFGKGFRAPSFKELFLDYSNISVGYHVIGNPKLEPETSRNVNLDVERWQTGKYHGRINLFWNEISGLIDYKYLGLLDGQSTYQSTNLSAVRTRGMELDFTYFITDQLESWIGFSQLDTWDKDHQRELPLKARHKVQAGIRYAFSNGMKINVRTQSMSERINWEEKLTGETIKKIIDPYMTLNANFAFPLPWGLQGFMGGKNLTNQVNQVWGPMPGREWYGGIRFDLTNKQQGN